MQKIHIVNEFELLTFARCPLHLPRTDRNEDGADSAAANAAAEDLLSWITWQSYERDVPELRVVRERAEAYFLKRYTGTMTLPIAKRLVRMSRRLHDLVSFNSVLEPQSTYQLDLGQVRIEGSMTVVKSKSKASVPPRVIRLRNH